MNINRAIRHILGHKPVKTEYKQFVSDSGVTNRVASARAGVFRCRVELADGNECRFIGKRKVTAIIANGIRLLSGGDPVLYLRLVMKHNILGYNGSSTREAKLYANLDSSLKPHLPEFIGAHIHPLTQTCFVAMEELPQQPPSPSDIPQLIDIIAEFHARYYRDASAAKRLGVNIYRTDDYKSARYCFRKMFSSLDNTVFGAERCAVIMRFIDDIHNEHSKVKSHSTLTHNDYSCRNVSCGERIRIYDWELSCFQNPEHDIIELLVSMAEHLTDEQLLASLEHHRERLYELTGERLSDEDYAAALRFSLLEFCVNKLTIIRLAGKRLGLDYTEQLAANASRLMDVLNIT